MGAVTFSPLGSAGHNGRGSSGVVDNRRAVKGTITFSASYATGGDTLDLSTVGLSELTGVFIDPEVGSNVGGLSIELGGTSVSPTVVAYETDDTEVANTTDLSARTAVPVWLLGT